MKQRMCNLGNCPLTGRFSEWMGLKGGCTRRAGLRCLPEARRYFTQDNKEVR